MRGVRITVSPFLTRTLNTTTLVHEKDGLFQVFRNDNSFALALVQTMLASKRCDLLRIGGLTNRNPAPQRCGNSSSHRVARSPLDYFVPNRWWDYQSAIDLAKKIEV